MIRLLEWLAGRKNHRKIHRFLDEERKEHRRRRFDMQSPESTVGVCSCPGLHRPDPFCQVHRGAA